MSSPPPNDRPQPWPTAAPSQRTAAVVGSPIAHSLSPALHRCAYDLLGGRYAAYAYHAYEVGEHQLADFVDHTLRRAPQQWLGLSVTMPGKVAALALADHCSALAQLVGAANTLFWQPGPDGRPRLCADNTDVPGLVAAFKQAGVHTLSHTAIIGGGATASSALAALAQMGVRRVDLHVRNPARATQCLQAAQRLGVQVALQGWQLPALDHIDAMIITTPGGAADALVADLPAVSRPLPVLFDVAYHPWPSAVARWWGAGQGIVLNGLDLLVQQAIDQVILMTGVDQLPLVRAQFAQRLRAAGLAQLAQPHGARQPSSHRAQ